MRRRRRKAICHENERRFLVLFFYCLFMMDVSQRLGSQKLINFKALGRTFRICERLEMPLFKYPLTHEHEEEAIAHRKRRTLPYTFLALRFPDGDFQHVETRGREQFNSQ